MTYQKPTPLFLFHPLFAFLPCSLIFLTVVSCFWLPVFVQLLGPGPIRSWTLTPDSMLWQTHLDHLQLFHHGSTSWLVASQAKVADGYSGLDNDDRVDMWDLTLKQLVSIRDKLIQLEILHRAYYTPYKLHVKHSSISLSVGATTTHHGISHMSSGNAWLLHNTGRK